MNGRQRATRLADKISDLQRLHKQFRGKPEATPLGHAILKLVEARHLALEDVSVDSGESEPENSDG